MSGAVLGSSECIPELLRQSENVVSDWDEIDSDDEFQIPELTLQDIRSMPYFAFWLFIHATQMPGSMCAVMHGFRQLVKLHYSKL